MKNISIVQAIIFAVMGLAIIAAVFIFAFSRNSSNQTVYSEVTIWGTLPQEIMEDLFIENSENFNHITYEEIEESAFQDELVSALAEGRGPDMVLLRENQILESKDLLVKIPYENYDLRTFRETFVEEGNLLAFEEGFVGLPFYIDPLVMYYNRNILNSNGIAVPPSTWTEFLALVSDLTIVDSSFNISKSIAGLGTYSNINNAKEIIWSLIMQAGNNVVIKEDFDGENPNNFISILSERLGYSNPPAVSAVNFYTQFANPSKTIYSWNRSLPLSQDYFLAGDSAFYFGFASELPTLSLKNPNLIFDVSILPQAKDSTKKTTYGKMYSIAITNGVKDLASAYNTLLLLTNIESQNLLTQTTGLPSVRRDLLTQSDGSNSFDPIFKKSALFAYGVLEPSVKNTDQIIREMIQSIISGQLEVGDSIDRANAQLNKELE